MTTQGGELPIKVTEVRNRRGPLVVGWILEIGSESLLVFRDQEAMPGFRFGDHFVMGMDDSFAYHPLRIVDPSP